MALTLFTAEQTRIVEKEFSTLTPEQEMERIVKSITYYLGQVQEGKQIPTGGILLNFKVSEETKNKLLSNGYSVHTSYFERSKIESTNIYW